MRLNPFTLHREHSAFSFFKANYFFSNMKLSMGSVIVKQQHDPYKTVLKKCNRNMEKKLPCVGAAPRRRGV